MIKCACGNDQCKIKIEICEDRLWFTDPDGKESFMALDPNTIVALMHELQRTLFNMTRLKEME